MKVVQRKIKKSGKDRKRIGRGGSAYILDKRRITAVQNMKREAEKEKLRERFAAAANMPKDVVLGASVVTVIGNGEISIENYRRADPGTDEKRADPGTRKGTAD